jgi:hypothetical protein
MYFINNAYTSPMTINPSMPLPLLSTTRHKFLIPAPPRSKLNCSSFTARMQGPSKKSRFTVRTQQLHAMPLTRFQSNPYIDDEAEEDEVGNHADSDDTPDSEGMF